MSTSTRIRTDTVGDRTVVAVAGPLDIAGAPALRQAIGELIRDGRVDLVVDLDEVDNIDDVGLGVLLGAGWRARERDGSFALVCSTSRIGDVLRASRLDRAIAVHTSIAEALAR